MLLHEIPRQSPQARTQSRPCFTQEHIELPHVFFVVSLQLHRTTFRMQSGAASLSVFNGFRRLSSFFHPHLHGSTHFSSRSDAVISYLA